MHGNSLILMLISYKTAKRGVHMDLGAFSEGYYIYTYTVEMVQSSLLSFDDFVEIFAILR